MSEILYLDDAQPLEVRDREERIVGGRIAPYNETIQVRGRPESFQQGAFSKIDPSKTKLLIQHDQGRPIGKMISLEERSDGAYAEFKVSKTRDGDEYLEMAADGLLSLSPGFFPGTQTQQGVHTEVRAMPETSLVTFSAYEGSQITHVREKEAVMPEETNELETREDAVDLSVLETRQDEMSRSLDALQARLDAPDGQHVKAVAPKPIDWFAAQIEEVGGKSYQKREALEEKWETFQTRALADVTGGGTQAGDNSPADDLSGLVVEEFVASQLVNVLDARRPFFASLGSFPMPRSGYAKIPTITQHVQVAARSGQKEDANSRKLISKNASYEAGWLDGAVDIALEVILTAELPVLSLIWDDFLRAYAQATEHDTTYGVVPKVEAGGLGFTYTDAALLDGSPTYSEFISAVETQVDTIDDATGEPPNRLAVTRAQWASLMGMVDGQGRRIFSTIGSENADASVPFTARRFDVAGITVYKVKGLTQAVLFNDSSLKAADSGPTRLEATNVALMGKDVGVIGRTMLIPRIPSGVVVFGTDPVS